MDGRGGGGEGGSNLSTKSMLSQQSPRRVTLSEIETRPLYRVPNLCFFKYPIKKGKGFTKLD